jgi:hypothetical protein
MRNFGLVLLALGVLGFFRASTQLGLYQPVPPGLSVTESLRYPAGKWEVAEYAAGAIAVVGALLVMLPKGRS